MSYFHTLSVSSSYCQNFFLGACFPKSALNSIDLFQGLPQDLQFKGSYLGSSVIGLSLGFPVIGSSLGSWDVAQKLCPLFWKNFIICLNNFRANYLRSSS